jgi:hypothetical protein
LKKLLLSFLCGASVGFVLAWHALGIKASAQITGAILHSDRPPSFPVPKSTVEIYPQPASEQPVSNIDNRTFDFESHRALLNGTRFPIIETTGEVTPQAMAYLGLTESEGVFIKQVCDSLSTRISEIESVVIIQKEPQGKKMKFEIPPVFDQIAEEIAASKSKLINFLGNGRGDFLWKRLEEDHSSNFSHFGKTRTELLVSRNGELLKVEESRFSPDGVHMSMTSSSYEQLPPRFSRLIDIVK